MAKRWGWWIFGAAVLVVMLYPKRLTVVPAYHVKLIDQFGKPLARTAVGELWQQTSVQRQEQLVQVETDANGEADLPEHILRAALMERMIGCFAYLARQGLAATCGNRHSIYGSGDLKELGREETISGILRRQHSLLLTLKQCEPGDPMIC